MFCPALPLGSVWGGVTHIVTCVSRLPFVTAVTSCRVNVPAVVLLLTDTSVVVPSVCWRYLCAPLVNVSTCFPGVSRPRTASDPGTNPIMVCAAAGIAGVHVGPRDKYSWSLIPTGTGSWGLSEWRSVMGPQGGLIMAKLDDVSSLAGIMDPAQQPYQDSHFTDVEAEAQKG